jgi:hypothetical protein
LLTTWYKVMNPSTRVMAVKMRLPVSFIAFRSSQGSRPAKENRIQPNAAAVVTEVSGRTKTCGPEKNGAETGKQELGGLLLARIKAKGL